MPALEVDHMFYQLINNITPKPNLYLLMRTRDSRATRVLDGRLGQTILHPMLDIEHERLDRVAWHATNGIGQTIDLKVDRLKNLLSVQCGFTSSTVGLPVFNAVGITGQAKPETERILLVHDVYELVDVLEKIVTPLYEPIGV